MKSLSFPNTYNDLDVYFGSDYIVFEKKNLDSLIENCSPKHYHYVGGRPRHKTHTVHYLDGKLANLSAKI